MCFIGFAVIRLFPMRVYWMVARMPYKSAIVGVVIYFSLHKVTDDE